MKGYEVALLVGIYVLALLTLNKVKHVERTVETIAMQIVAEKVNQVEANR